MPLLRQVADNIVEVNRISERRHSRVIGLGLALLPKYRGERQQGSAQVLFSDGFKRSRQSPLRS